MGAPLGVCFAPPVPCSKPQAPRHVDEAGQADGLNSGILFLRLTVDRGSLPSDQRKVPIVQPELGLHCLRASLAKPKVFNGRASL